MFGKNPKRGPVKGDGSMLAVQEVFPTLQGEGPYTGWPSVFVRLGGCNLACTFCDTEFESFTERNTTELVQQVENLAQEEGVRVRTLVVITGGEPLRQPIGPFCEALLTAGFKVQIESNGTLWRLDIPAEVDLICSPKAPSGTYGPLREDILARANALKFIVSADQAGYTEVPEVGQSKFGVPIYVQPMDEYDAVKNAANLQHALALAQKRGYRLSLQTHKLMGIP